MFLLVFCFYFLLSGFPSVHRTSQTFLSPSFREVALSSITSVLFWPLSTTACLVSQLLVCVELRVPQDLHSPAQPLSVACSAGTWGVLNHSAHRCSCTLSQPLSYAPQWMLSQLASCFFVLDCLQGILAQLHLWSHLSWDSYLCSSGAQALFFHCHDEKKKKIAHLSSVYPTLKINF